MTWANLTATGSGSIRLALIIEGWPDMFVTDDSLLFTSGLQNRNVYAGLQFDGIQFSERLIPQDAIPEPDSITFRIVPTTRADEVLASFSKRGNRVAELTADLTDSATSLTVRDSSLLSTNTRYHIGTETIVSGLVTPTSSITRGNWDTTAQYHNLSYFEGEHAVWLYDSPPTMQGRRVQLIAFGEGDSTSQPNNGTVVWRGVVRRPPQLDSDGITWLIDCDHIVSLLQQTVVGHSVEARIVGIYHHEIAPVIIQLWYNGSSSSTYYIEGYHDSPENLADEINTDIASAITDVSGGSAINKLELIWDSRAQAWVLHLDTGGTVSGEIGIFMGSPLMQFASGTWIVEGTQQPVDPFSVLANTSYVMYFTPEPEVAVVFPGAGGGRSVTNTPIVVETVIDPPTFPVAALGGPGVYSTYINVAQDPPADAALSASRFRLYVDTDMSPVDGQMVMIEGATASLPFSVSATGTDSGKHYLEVSQFFSGNQGAQIGFQGFLNGETVIRPVLDLGNESDLEEFIDQVITRATENANDGVTPYVTYDDIASTGSTVDWEVTGVHNDKITRRQYAFYETMSLYDILQAELRLVAHMMYVDDEAKLDIRPLPKLTSTLPTDKTITEDDIITPFGAQGMWPRWQLLAQGMVNTVTLKDGYNPLLGEWQRTWVMADADSVATHKNRGTGDLEIAPVSVSALGLLEFEEVKEIADVYTGFLARDYASITVEVPFSKFDYLVGDVVKLTCELIPDGAGGRGVSNQRAVVIGREWNLDPRGPWHGRLTLWMLLDQPSGYAPGGVVTGQTNDSGDTWTITLDSTNTTNKAVSTDNDGKIIQHFQAGDHVRVMDSDDPSAPTTVVGTVDSTDPDNDQITVTFTSTWTPGSTEWWFIPRVDSGSTATTHQRGFVYVADSNGLLADGTIARVFG